MNEGKPKLLQPGFESIASMTTSYRCLVGNLSYLENTREIPLASPRTYKVVYWKAQGTGCLTKIQSQFYLGDIDSWMTRIIPNSRCQCFYGNLRVCCTGPCNIHGITRIAT